MLALDIDNKAVSVTPGNFCSFGELPVSMLSLSWSPVREMPGLETFQVLRTRFPLLNSEFQKRPETGNLFQRYIAGTHFRLRLGARPEL
jgi:hypothetical protein